MSERSEGAISRLRTLGSNVAFVLATMTIAALGTLFCPPEAYYVGGKTVVHWYTLQDAAISAGVVGVLTSIALIKSHF